MYKSINTFASWQNEAVTQSIRVLLEDSESCKNVLGSCAWEPLLSKVKNQWILCSLVSWWPALDWNVTVFLFSFILFVNICQLRLLTYTSCYVSHTKLHTVIYYTTTSHIYWSCKVLQSNSQSTKCV